jgi:nicotinate-nucleotide adenylyltransferase
VELELGLLGGAFDPPHVGHVALARAALEHFRLPRLLVLVVADPGHKRTNAPAEARLELARVAFEELPLAEVELDQHERTVDFLEQRRPVGAVFVVGGDEFADFPTWKKPERVLELVRLGVALRPGVPDGRVREALARVPEPDRISFFEMPPVPVSSSEVRERVRRGGSVEGLVPAQVAATIERLGLYSDAQRRTTLRRSENAQKGTPSN